MHTDKKIFVALAALTLFTLGGVQTLQNTNASVITDCVGKPYGTAGCPVKNQSSTGTTCNNNGIIDPGEECDLGKIKNGVSNCTTSCTLLYCGDGIISPQLSEECEPDTEEVYAVDPNTGQLTTEVHYLQPSCGSTCTVPTCDAQGNCTGGCERKFLAACPAATNTTTLQAASSVSSSVSSSSKASAAASSVAATPVVSTVPRCGNSIVDLAEQCDDGPLNSNLPGAHCRLDCTYPKCGDAIVDTARGEQCDDGPNNSDLPNSHCRSTCLLPKCGDGFIDTSRGEQCDDGPNNANAANAHCRLDCVLQHCGDGVRDQSEECDDGPNNSDMPNARCSKMCTLPKCGDGVVQSGEQCDKGPNNSDDPNAQCRLTCQLPKCGDGVIDPSRGEQCDDGPNNSDLAGAHCRMNCSLPKCGDGLVQAGEECDDGTKNSDTRPNACRMDCKAPHCGDRIMDADEQCDHGDKNGTSGDSCTAECENLKSAAPAAITGNGYRPLIPVAIGLAGLGTAAVLAFVLRKYLHKFVSHVAGEEVAASIDDIPLDQIEMPWHKW